MTVNATVDNKNKQIGSAADMQRTIDTELNIFVFVNLFQGFTYTYNTITQLETKLN